MKELALFPGEMFCDSFAAYANPKPETIFSQLFPLTHFMLLVSFDTP